MNSWSYSFRRSLPGPIRINSCNLSSCISMNDSIWIHHGYNFENKSIIEWTLSLMSWHHKIKQIFDNSFNHKTWCSLHRMLSTQNPNYLAILNSFPSRSNRNDIDRIFTNCLTKFLNRQKRLISFIGKHTIKKIEKLRVGIRIRRCKIDSIIGISKLILKRKRIKRLISMIPLNTILLIKYLNSISMPTSSLLTKFLRKHQRLQSIAKQWLFLSQIDNIKPHLLVFLTICHLEIKPLIMTSRIYIVLKNQVVCLYITWEYCVFECVHQITTLEVRIEYYWTWIHCLLIDFWFYLRKISQLFALQIDSCSRDENTSKIMFLLIDVESTIIHFSFTKYVP